MPATVGMPLLVSDVLLTGADGSAGVTFADNSLKYEATLRFINGHVRTMLDAMKSPQQG